METKSKTLGFSNEKQSVSQDLLCPSHSQLDDLGQQISEINAEKSMQLKYYDEYKKIYYTSFKLWSEKTKQIKAKEGLASRVKALEVNLPLLQSQLTNLHRSKKIVEEIEPQDDGNDGSKYRNNKRIRRTLEEIQRKFVCNAEFCDRCYGYEGSLQHHIKMKHPEMYKKETQSQQF